MVYKDYIVAHAAETVGITKKEAEAVVNATLEAITNALSEGEKVQLTGFGTFEVKHKNARTGRNPHTGEAISIPAKNVPNFKPGKALKELIS